MCLEIGLQGFDPGLAQPHLRVRPGGQVEVARKGRKWLGWRIPGRPGDAAWLRGRWCRWLGGFGRRGGQGYLRGLLFRKWFLCRASRAGRPRGPDWGTNRSLGGVFDDGLVLLPLPGDRDVLVSRFHRGRLHNLLRVLCKVLLLVLHGSEGLLRAATLVAARCSSSLLMASRASRDMLPIALATSPPFPSIFARVSCSSSRSDARETDLFCLPRSSKLYENNENSRNVSGNFGLVFKRTDHPRRERAERQRDRRSSPVGPARAKAERAGARAVSTLRSRRRVASRRETPQAER